MFRKALFWTHLVAGVTAGVVILLMSVTGVLLTYEKQIIAYVDRNAQPLASGPAMQPEALLAALPGATNVTMRSGAGEPWTVVKGRETVLVDPANGKVLGPQTPGVRAFFRFVTDWHRWLGASTANRAGARSITGISNLLFLFIVVSGLYLWMPRTWAWPNVRSVTLFKGGLAGKARDFNWHNVAGFWCFVPLFFVVLSGVVISYPWASNMVYQAYGMQPPAQGKGKAKGGEAKGGEGKQREGKQGEGKQEGRGRAQEVLAAVDLSGINALVERAKTQAPEWRTIGFAVPASEKAPVVFSIDSSGGGQPQKRATLMLDRASASVVKWETFADQEPGRQARTWMRFVHTGEYYGLLGQTVAGIVSAGGALLVWTGLALAWRRFRAWSGRRSRAAAGGEQVAA